MITTFSIKGLIPQEKKNLPKHGESDFLPVKPSLAFLPHLRKGINNE
jgi:hypothetical protein